MLIQRAGNRESVNDEEVIVGYVKPAQEEEFRQKARFYWRAISSSGKVVNPDLAFREGALFIGYTKVKSQVVTLSWRARIRRVLLVTRAELCKKYPFSPASKAKYYFLFELEEIHECERHDISALLTVPQKTAFNSSLHQLKSSPLFQ